ncbi:MAG: Rrf2 family transcriptional regulator [Desulfovibrio sp.]|jgi:Rrf2 family protein|nr:Rrf2 family transcriptional regulator [Desulfovibrio sp.]
MQLSVNTRYAIRLISALGAISQPVSAASISEQIGLSLRAVETVHAVLRRHGITEATGGARGGIRLALPLSDITVGKLMRCFGDGVDFKGCRSTRLSRCQTQGECAACSNWENISGRIQDFLDEITLKEIVGR